MRILVVADLKVMEALQVVAAKATATSSKTFSGAGSHKAVALPGFGEISRLTGRTNMPGS